MISFIKSFFLGKKLIPAVFPRSWSPEFEVLADSIADEFVLYDDGWVRVTPCFVQVENDKKIVVSKIRELRQGDSRRDGLAGSFYRILLGLLINGIVIFLIYHCWLFSAACLAGLVATWFGYSLGPYYLTLYTNGFWGESFVFPSKTAMSSCERAIEEAIQAVK